jgi:hypothetical protein
MPVIKDPRAIALCDQIRPVFPKDPPGWICCPHHTRRHIQIGHKAYGSDPAITEQIDALAHAIERLDLTRGLDYTVVIVSR